jgi:hypothetical protein
MLGLVSGIPAECIIQWTECMVLLGKIDWHVIGTPICSEHHVRRFILPVVLTIERCRQC